MNKVLSLTANVEKSPNKGGWHYIDLPEDLLNTLRQQAAKNGNVPIIVTIGNTNWKSTIMSRGDQQWYLPLSSDVREAEAIHEGDTVSLKITPDFEKLKKFKNT